MGRHWSSTSLEQSSRFVREFRRLLINTCSAS
ncbi:MAG: ABC transporter substrate-binding protein [Thiogranum sp.]